ncbi:MAG: carboxypeptidase-like regulatory domain-containing protein [Bacteroidales bacterium]
MKTRNNKYGTPGQDKFSGYLGDKMSGKEKNSFEKELQKDPFLEEAAEGLSAIGADMADADLKKLKSRLSGRTKSGSLPILRIAATLLLLAAIGTLVIITGRRERENDQQLAVNKDESPMINTPVAVDGTERKSEQISAEISKQGGSSDKDAMEKSDFNASKEVENHSDLSQDTSIHTEKLAVGGNLRGEIAAPSMAAISTNSPDYAGMISGVLISSEDFGPVPGATILIKGTSLGTTTDMYGRFSLESSKVSNRALVASYIGMNSKEFQAASNSENRVVMDPSLTAMQEVVVVSPSALPPPVDVNNNLVRSDVKARGIVQEYLPPEPEDGLETYEKYAEENLRKPEIFKPGNRVIVIVTFTVKADGAIDSMKVIRSGGKDYDDEAIRLIIEGPAWKPATRGGDPVDDEVRIRVKFR